VRALLCVLWPRLGVLLKLRQQSNARQRAREQSL
jgi:hypothetical protein